MSVCKSCAAAAPAMPRRIDFLAGSPGYRPGTGVRRSVCVATRPCPSLAEPRPPSRSRTACGTTPTVRRGRRRRGRLPNAFNDTLPKSARTSPVAWRHGMRRAQQSCPELSNTAPGAAAAARSISESAKIIFALFPPSSKVTRLT